MECNYCKSTSFDELDGYNYCSECGRRNEKDLVFLRPEQEECDSDSALSLMLDPENLEKNVSISDYSNSIHLEHEEQIRQGKEIISRQCNNLVNKI